MKELEEKLNDLKAKAQNIVATAKKEKRAVTAEEKEDFDNAMAEIKDIETTIAMEKQANELEIVDVVVDNVMSQEAKTLKTSQHI